MIVLISELRVKNKKVKLAKAVESSLVAFSPKNSRLKMRNAADRTNH